ncbi:lysine-specific demethylase 3A isoform X1 [Anopheles moucheti]|uniref:lysine-specific demethylase 3A isoform X1 n=1 Tax=Anopheles moucheti TaxID=186751 RepID=UPI0022F0D8C7|nr:lysine-specific demethylase 3A isoform X1 [Anopheles moucheti]
MSSEDQHYLQNDFQRRWEMFQNRVTPENSRQSFPTEQQAGNFATSFAARVPPAPPQSTAYCNKTNGTEQKKTFEQVYKDVVEKRFNTQAKRGPSRVKVEVEAVVEPAPSTSRKQEEYITTVYNITPRELPSTSRKVTPPSLIKIVNPPVLTDASKHSLLIPRVSASASTLEGISYQKTHANAYAKHLLDITKSNLHKIEMSPSATESKNTTPRTVHGPDEPAATNRTPPSIPTVKTLFTTHSDFHRKQQEIYRLLQLHQDRRTPNPSVKTFAQNGEPILVSKHRTNVMLTILKPNATSPAPAHVYRAPDVTPPPAHRNHQAHYNAQELNEGRQLLNLVQVAAKSSTEPPPAHRAVTEPPPKTALAPTQSNTASIIPKQVHHGQSQVEALNLDTKHETSTSNSLIAVKESAPFPYPTVCSSAPLPMQQTAALPISHTKESRNADLVQDVAANMPSAIWEQIQAYNLQKLLQGMQARQMMESNKVLPKQAEIDQQLQQQQQQHLQLQQQQQQQQEPAVKTEKLTVPSVIPTPPMDSTMVKMEYEKMIYQTIQVMKRKNATQELDPTKKRRSYPRKKRPPEAFLQNGPCYKVASRLPRCRECGRSASARYRNAIFCRFIAFRKLKYNDLGQLEVFGFADPFLDAKDADTGLWSSNLQKVPADLTVEKSKFLLGQVGYKFCELFHQEKEAYFEHMAEDKTIAWKQAVYGVREMCDVCQTTLFNHHWVCTACGFVVCIDCYKCRKNGIITVESTTKDKDPNGWLLCSATKEPHDQTLLMLTQIIPSKCLYKLVRQMHGICALLEIPLNCECPLSKEHLFRKIKDKFEFIYPITPDGGNGADVESSFGDVSVTIKHIEQMGFAGSTASNDPVECRIVFAQQYRDGKGQQKNDEWDAPGMSKADDETTKEKQSYSFDGFVREIHTDGDHFDERLYKIPTVSPPAPEVKQEIMQDKEEITQETTAATIENVMAVDRQAEENVLQPVVQNEADVGKDCISCATNGSETEDKPIQPSDGVSTNGAKEANEGETSTFEPLDNESAPAVGNGTGEDTKVKQPVRKQKLNEALSTVPVPYSEDDRYKPSPAMDQITFAMIIKQMVKSDKTIFERLHPHMVSRPDQLNDFAECISIERERVQQFVRDFLDEFINLRGQHSNDDLTNERLIVDYNRSMKDGLRYRNKAERKMNLISSKTLYTDVAHEWLCNGKLLRLLNPLDVHNYRIFHEQWERGQPVMVSAVSSKMDMDLWMPASFGRDFGEDVNDLINCFNGKIVRGHQMKVFWDGFEEIGERLVDERERPMMLKLKDWPPGDDFAEMMPTRFYDLMKSLPLAEYTRREGRLNLASRLTSFFVRPDLGPKMYSAYGSALHPTKGTTNLHLDISDAVNVMVYVGVPKDAPRRGYNEKIVELIDSEDCDYLTRQRIRERKELPGALWHIYHAQDADKIRALLNKIELERGGTIKPNHDPIHDQKWYLDRNMRKRLQQEYQVEGYAIVQCSGDAIFIPAGAPHQVRNLHNCIKVAEDFVSPENIAHCLKLTNEFRHLSRTHSNHEDKLQIKNIIYHTVKDAVSCITNPLIMMTCPERTEG